MKIKFDLQLFSYLFGDLTDKERVEMIKVLIMCHPNGQEFRDVALKAIEKMEID